MEVEAWNGGEAKVMVIDKVKEQTGCHAFHAKAMLKRDDK